MNPNTSLTPTNHHRLWISAKWYIPVDNHGECAGLCLEGALGFVVQLLSGEGDDLRRALKMPRLLGETHRENAYISDLMEKELQAVQEVIDKPMGTNKGLLRADIWEPGGPLRGQISTKKGPPDAFKWNEAIVLVHFEKGRKPRFCLVKKCEVGGNTQLEKFPPTIQDCPVTTVQLYDRLQEVARSSSKDDPGSERQWKHTVFIDTGMISSGMPTILNKQEALQASATGKTWFTCVPSIPYEWAPGTLQEAISLGKRSEEWGVAEHFSLARRICMGIYALHSKGMLHADLRPANLVYTGKPSSPDSYYVCDYGSFAKMGARDPDYDPTGNTVLGPVAGTERASVFYAPERRAGLEREAADTAVIRSNQGGTTLDIELSWRSKLDDQARNSEVNKKTAWRPGNNQNQSARNNSASGSSLQKGDRIQIRDYIFDIISATENDGVQRLVCDPHSWKIYQGRIVVENRDPFLPEQWLPIPRTVELQQWSAATDLYSLGALFLYSVYRSEKPPLDEMSGRTEEKFREMLGYLEGESYFNHIWPEVEALRAQLEVSLEQNTDASATQFASLKFKKPGSENNNESPKETTLKAETISVVQRITQTVPWSRRLVAVFDFNVGTFLFFIHFVLCCLHRQSHLKESSSQETSAGAIKRERPFCKDRCETPREDGGANIALKRLKRIRRIIDDPRLELLKAEPFQIPSYEPRPEPVLKAALDLLTQAAKKAVSDGNDILKEAREDIKRSVFGKVMLPKVSTETTKVSYVPGRSVAELREPFQDLATAIEQSQRSDLLAINVSRAKPSAEPPND